MAKGKISASGLINPLSFRNRSDLLRTDSADDLQDLNEIFAGRSLHGNALADLASDQSFSHRGNVRNTIHLDIGFRRTYDLIHRFFLFVFVVNSHLRSDRHNTFLDIARFDDLGSFQLCFDLDDLALDPRLLVLCGVIFGIFGLVAEISRHFDPFGDLRALGKF